MSFPLEQYVTSAFCPPPRLLVSFYLDPNAVRAAELESALFANIANPWIGEVLVVCEGEAAASYLATKLKEGGEFDKVRLFQMQARPTFWSMCRVADRAMQAEGHPVTLLINSDIVLGPGVDLAVRDLWLESRKGNRPMLLLSRHEVEWAADGMGGTGVVRGVVRSVGGGSHDLWAWVGAADLPAGTGDFHMGKWHCDGVFAHQLWKNCGFALKNPSRDAVILHIHSSNVRNYSVDNPIFGYRLGVKQVSVSDPWSADDLYNDGYTFPGA